MSEQDQLKQRLEKGRMAVEQLGKMHHQRLFQYEQAQKTVKECEEEAKELGVSTPEELQALLEKLEQEDRTALETWEADIRKNAEKLRMIEQQVQKEGLL